MTKTLTCIVCPNGCELEAAVENGELTALHGAGCKRGEQYARQELVHPMRTLSSSVRLLRGEMPLASVRLDRPVPREALPRVMEEIRRATLQAPVAIGDLVITSVAGLNANVIVTRNIGRA